MVIVLMGVTGSGKTTIGKLLSNKLGWKFYDADDFHPQSNVQKMQQGIPLDDTDRLPWLESLAKLIDTAKSDAENIILACSALKQSYRNILCKDRQAASYVYLQGSVNLLEERLRSRRGHFMNPNLLSSQLSTLEEPGENAIYIDISNPPQDIVSIICNSLELETV